MNRINIQDIEPMDYAPGQLSLCISYRMEGITIEYPDGRRKRIYNMTVRQLGKFMAFLWSWKSLSCIGPCGWIIYYHSDKKG